MKHDCYSWSHHKVPKCQRWNLETLTTSSVAHRPAVWASLASLLERQNLRLPQTLASEFPYEFVIPMLVNIWEAGIRDHLVLKHRDTQTQRHTHNRYCVDKETETWSNTLKRHKIDFLLSLKKEHKLRSTLTVLFKEIFWKTLASNKSLKALDIY